MGTALQTQMRPLTISPQTETSSNNTPLRLFLVLGEPSGDALAASLLQPLADHANRPLHVYGLAGEKLLAMGAHSLFPISDIAVMGLSGVLANLPRIFSRIHQTAQAIIQLQPDVVLYCDSPDFAIRVARRVRTAGLTMPQIKYICPSVWAWRPGRAKAMNGIYDAVLAILPFEPEVMQRLGGPPTHYVGHPLNERIAELAPSPQELATRQHVVVLPGSRTSEVKRLMPIFGQAIAQLQAKVGAFEVLIPTVPHVRELVEMMAQDWPITPHIIVGETEKYASFRTARVALAASGTVTLELALAQLPSVVAYKVDPLASLLRFLVKVPSIVLPNLVAGTNGYPEFILERCTPELLCAALADIWHDAHARQQQLQFCKTVVAALQTDVPPNTRIAQIIERHISC